MGQNLENCNKETDKLQVEKRPSVLIHHQITRYYTDRFDVLSHNKTFKVFIL